MPNNIYNQPSQRNYNNIGTRNNGFQYKILPLSFNLQQKGNDINTKRFNKCSFNIGDYVYGYDINDDIHYGNILRIKINIHNKITRIYILDEDTRKQVSLIPDTVQIKRKRMTENFGFDKAVNESLFDDINLDNNIEDEVSSTLIGIDKQRELTIIRNIIKALLETSTFAKLYTIEQLENSLYVINKNNPEMIIIRVDKGDILNQIQRITFYKLPGSALVWFMFHLINLLPMQVKDVIFHQKLVATTTYKNVLHVQGINYLTADNKKNTKLDDVQSINTIIISNKLLDKFPHITLADQYIQISLESLSADTFKDYAAFINKLHSYNIDVKFENCYCTEYDQDISELLNCYSYTLGPVNNMYDNIHRTFIYGDMTPRLIKHDIEEIKCFYNVNI